MSHFAVTVCLPAGTDVEKVEQVLEDVMARWDENRAVEPYRVYEDGSPEDYWWVGSVRRGAEHHRAGTGIKPYSADIFAGNDFSRKTEAEQRAEFADDAQRAELLGEHPTWADVVMQYNAKWHPNNALAVPGEEEELDTERLHHDEETDRAHTWSTRNPDSMWDYWRIGGRWRNHFASNVRVKVGLDWENGKSLIRTSKDWDGPKGNDMTSDGFIRCDGGPKRLLDFDAMRQHAADEANARYDQWDALCADTPPAKDWAHFVGLRDAGELTIEEARQQYHAQPRIVASRKVEDLKWYDDIIERFSIGRDEYVANARRDEVPGYALITIDRQWMAPGRMGWFGMSSDEPGTVDAYKTEANAYLEGLDPEVVIVQLDLHI